jgi:hypothetical protein
LSIIVLSSATGHAASTAATGGFIFPGFGTDTGPIATTFGRASIEELVFQPIVVSEDPVGGARGVTRVIPPSATAFFLGAGSASASVIGAGPGMKKVIALAALQPGALLTQAESQVFDPVTYPKSSTPTTINVVPSLIDLVMQTEPGDHASYHLDFTSAVLSSQPLFQLDITAQNGGVPAATFQISALLQSQPGWIKSSLEAQLDAALLAGAQGGGSFEVQNFSLPQIETDVPANVSAVFDTNTMSEADSLVPEPPSAILLAVGCSVLLVWKVWASRAKICVRLAERAE